MRTLLVDNHDSFTYNLFHLLAEVNGEPPAVVRNDEALPGGAGLDGFDNVVLSPGPGTPREPRDFGLCRAVLETARIPLLGVCLGHQGLALAHGADVVPAPEPRHGRTSPVEHDGTGLFAGLPSPFQAVRYHSLMAADLPGDLEVIARTPDGVVMALRHRTLPRWGVQFHPESICTEHGRHLLRNFRDLTASSRPRSRHRARPQARREAGQEARSRLRPPAFEVLAGEVRVPLRDEVVFDALFRPAESSFWLDSGRRDGETGRFSMMGDASGPLARVATADVTRGVVTVRSAGGRSREVRAGFFDWLRDDLEATRARAPDLPFGFAPGWVGYLGYELKAECGGAAAHRSGDPDAAMIFADRALVFDHLTGVTHLLALARRGDGAAARRWIDDTSRTLHDLARRPPEPMPAAEPGTVPARVSLRHDRRGYLDLIGACHDAIVQGESYEVCLTNMLEARTRLDPWLAYRWLRRAHPAPHGALLTLGTLSVLSASPERFLRVTRDGRVESSPIKGTRPRGATPAEDEVLRKDLAASEKDRAENLMIVDLVRNDLGRTAELGSVHVHRLFEVETYAGAHQLVSTVRARLRAGVSPVECVRAAFPGGSMTGAPKLRTMEILDGLERGPRGVYSGAIGYFAVTGDVDLGIVIRTAVVTPGRVRYGVGGAIVALSDPAAEYEETAVKAAPVLGLLGTGFPGRERPS
ncbi:aminodeoxychorismate synthase component I [Actinomadura xylanilytica]|uniref:aminodeoxychorismate synthase component I n=1 Tax=Actinomadura xylanilytica TaxID=887459 RepID=UPI00255B0A55|nr:aminodeoxychorismate synthase component I [Actinomadura xylanilytica]MDL4772415.1 aminodeoxychorismate synthase component I [Actinomadura xylanilytica]